MRGVTILVAGAAALAALALLAFLTLGPARIWGVFGPADLGPVDFARLERRTSPNDALVCPPGACGTARADILAPAFAVDVATLRRALEKLLADEARLTRVAVDESAGTARYVQRTRLLGFPDTIDVRWIALPDGRSSLALYSRSKLGHSDLGANRARLERWLARLAASVPAAG